MQPEGSAGGKAAAEVRAWARRRRWSQQVEEHLSVSVITIINTAFLVSYDLFRWISSLRGYGKSWIYSQLGRIMDSFGIIKISGYHLKQAVLWDTLSLLAGSTANSELNCRIRSRCQSWHNFHVRVDITFSQQLALAAIPSVPCFTGKPLQSLSPSLHGILPKCFWVCPFPLVRTPVLLD